MAPGNRTSGVSDSEARARARVTAASAERSRLRTEHDRARGTARELEADVLLRAADDEVVARERWLRWAEELDY